MNRNGALAGIIVGGVCVVVWKQLSGGWFDLYEIVPAFIASLLAIVITSLLTKQPNSSIQQRHQKMLNELS